MTSETDPEGHTTTITYGPDQMVRTVREADGGLNTFQPGDSLAMGNAFSAPGGTCTTPVAFVSTTAIQDTFTDSLSRITRYITGSEGEVLRSEDALARVV